MRIAVLLAGLLLLSPILRADERQAVTVDWIFGDEGKALTALPATQWTTDGLLLLDASRPKAERTIERVKPESGARSSAVNAKAALESLRPLVEAKDLPDALEWPASFDGAGRRAAYVIADDLFLLDLAASRFERLTRTAEKEEACRLSPDGRKLAFARGGDLYALDLGSRTETRLTRDGAAHVLNGTLSWVYWEEVFDHGEAGYWWSADSASIAFLRTDETAVSTMVFPDFAPAVPRVIEQRYPKAGGANPSVRLGIVDVANARAVWADLPASAYEYVLQVKWTPDGRHLAFETLNRAQDRSELQLMDRETGRVGTLAPETDPAWVYVRDFHFLRDGRFVATSERSGQTHFYGFDEEGTMRHPVTSGPWSVRGPSAFQGSPQGAAAMDESRGFLYFTGREASVLEQQLYRVGLDGSGLVRLSHEAGVHAVDWSADRRYYVDRHSSHLTPPSLSLHSADGKAKAVLAAPRTDIASRIAYRYPEPLTVPAADGTPLQAQVLKPEGFDATRRYPLILNVYGEPNAPLVEDRFWGATSGPLFAQALIAEGYVVALVDARSATGATKADVSSVLRHAGGDVELSDLVAAVRWFKAQPWIDPERVGVWGWSGGGTTTLLLVTRSTEFKAAISVAGVTDRAYYDTKYVEAFMKTPEANPEGYEAVNLVKRAKDLHGRLLLVHGSGDDNVHPQNTWAFVDELVKAGKTFELMIYPMRKHDIGDQAARVHLFKRMLEFWRANL